jgi:hypothetical protein
MSDTVATPVEGKQDAPKPWIDRAMANCHKLLEKATPKEPIMYVGSAVR